VLDNTNQKPPRSVIRTGKLVVNLDTRIESVDDRAVHLTGKEYGLLELLSLHKGTVVTKEMFFKHLYRGKEEPGFRIIDVFVCKLRQKLALAAGGRHYIETVWGRGFVLRDPVIAHGTSIAGAGMEEATERWQGHEADSRQTINEVLGRGVNKARTEPSPPPRDP
jgi:two-component system, cell cycle response regulator CtrA